VALDIRGGSDSFLASSKNTRLRDTVRVAVHHSNTAKVACGSAPLQQLRIGIAGDLAAGQRGHVMLASCCDNTLPSKSITRIRQCGIGVVRSETSDTVVVPLLRKRSDQLRRVETTRVELQAFQRPK
jgi:hypothetical protein